MDAKLVSDKEKSVDQIIEERGQNYGDFRGGMRCIREIMDAVNRRHREVNNKDLSNEDWVYIFTVVSKLSRIAVTPNHTDSWKDLAGYGLLVEKIKLEDEQDNVAGV